MLRGMVRADLAAYAAMWREPEVIRFTGGKVRDDAESWASFLRNAGSWTVEGYGQWGIFRKADGLLLGHTGFFRALRGLSGDFDGACEAGWVLCALAHRQGFGPEAVAAAHGWFDAQNLGAQSWAMIDVDHAVSLKLATPVWLCATT